MRRQLEFAHPRTGETLSLEAGLPEELGVLLEQLRGVAGKRRRAQEDVNWYDGV